MIFTNAKVFRESGEYIEGGFIVEDGKFIEVFAGERAGDVDLKGAKVIPGLVDIHIHGAAGADFSDGDMDGLTRMARTLAKLGVTGFLPTSMTLPYETLAKAFDTAVELRDNRPDDCARPLGIHMEGPFFSEKKKGAQNADYLKTPDFDAFEKLQRGCDNFIRMVDLAPELEGSVEFTTKASKECTVSIAHTDSGYEDACAVLDAGANHLTHTYNAMPPIHHRKPGVIGAGSERDNVFAELICDGYHIHPSSVRMAFMLFPGRICLVSDAVRCCGMPEGKYDLGGQDVFLKDGIAKLEDGTIAGAASDLFADMKNAISFGISEAEAICCATINPAKSVGVEDMVGSIAEGKYADFIVCDDELNLVEVYIDGKRI